ncbi:RNA polymerase sigma factor SigJ [Kribbella pratensis]|jgi:RNA polymerase sigma factor (sigma-70 family)|uniref:RNA polymerase sigma-70 factor (ECF subfamily) n=1 Tax=Kribbella pratensis TaxID=2512112 RepID=A0A4R8C2T0_9ACTN|nr:RNA polymerase sigma factor SigJ [Kribbella pratensis]TDW66105.1 RNA polymerase sigma-70 factor (ECF subfamily) [Kribbella pratensis]
MNELSSTEVFLRHRELLFSIVYNILGSVADTEDVLQETWLAWSRRSGVDHPRAYLVRIAVNAALARRTAINRRKEEYVGPWLPEPVVTPIDPVERSEAVSLAVLVVLETLSPLERAVFVLHEVFGYQLAEIADIIGRTPAAVRQLAHRAREHVQARRPRFAADPQVQLEVTQRFVDAIVGADLTALMEVLAPDVTLWADGGGKARAAGLQPILGRDRIAPLIIGDRVRRPVPSLDVQYRTVNGDPSALLLTGDTPFAVIVLEVEGDQVTAIYAITNPDKLAHVEVR